MFITLGTHAQFVNLTLAVFVPEVILFNHKLLLMNLLSELFILYFIDIVFMNSVLYNILTICFETFGYSWDFLLLSNVLGHTLGYFEVVSHKFEVLSRLGAILGRAYWSFFATLISIPALPSNFTFVLILHRYWVYHLHFLRLTYKFLLIFIHG